MMYRLKSEAVKFLAEKHATKIYPLDTWESIGIDINALEQVEDAYVMRGIGNSLGSWSQTDGQKFQFTIHFPSLKYQEHDKFSKDRMVRKLMDKIQSDVNCFMQDFINDKIKVLE